MWKPKPITWDDIKAPAVDVAIDGIVVSLKCGSRNMPADRLHELATDTVRNWIDLGKPAWPSLRVLETTA